MDFKKLSDFMDHLTSWRIPGCACVVYYKGKPVFNYSSGYADIENKIPFSADHRLFMYSISKIITCATALSLWEEGRFDLNDPLSKFLPEWKDVKVKETDADGNEIDRVYYNSTYYNSYGARIAIGTLKPDGTYASIDTSTGEYLEPITTPEPTPEPTVPDPTTPDPTTPEPDPTTPDPVTPDPVTPDPATPDPATPETPESPPAT